MMANDAFFTWLGMQIHITFWRQLITFVGLIVVYKTIQKKDIAIYEIRKILGKYKYMFFAIFALSFLTIIIQGFNVIRIVYAWWSYAFGLPFILFPYFARQCGWSRRKIDYLFVYLGLFLSAGIFADFMLGGLFTKSFLLQVIKEEGSFEAGRYCFLSSAPTIFSIYYCMCMMCCMHAFKHENKALKKYLLFVVALFFIYGSMFCGSRQTLAALVVVFAFGVFDGGLKGNAFIVICVIALTVVFALPKMMVYIESNEAIGNRYTLEQIQEDERKQLWIRGVRECLTEPSLQRVLIGDGIGYVHGQKASGSEAVGTHYENTFFTRISEMGWGLGFYMLLLPVFYILKRRKTIKEGLLLYYSVCVAYIMICCVSPNGGSNTAQMALFITLGLFIEDGKNRS